MITEFKEFCDFYCKKHDGEADVLFNEMLNFFEKNESGKKTVKKINVSSEKPKRTTKEVPDEERCMALLKKNNQRCTRKRNKEGENDKLCTLHNKNKPEKLYVESDVEKSEPSIESKKLNKEEFLDLENNDNIKRSNPFENTCTHKYVTGSKRGQLCGKETDNGKKLCEDHLQKCRIVAKKSLLDSEPEISEHEMTNDEKVELFGEEELSE
ncbi:MAG TPA: hypothetical protein V6C58_17510 [Allocoleopsis sp.]